MFCAASDWQSGRSGSSGLEEERDRSQVMFGSESWMKKCARTVKSLGSQVRVLGSVPGPVAHSLCGLEQSAHFSEPQLSLLQNRMNSPTYSLRHVMRIIHIKCSVHRNA